jgi:hypothetical protein
MALAAYALPFGLRQVKLVPLKSDGTEDVANGVFLPASRTFTFKESEDFSTLAGDDKTVASHGAGPTVGWELEGGGISLDAWKVLGGGTVATSGTSPNTVKTFTKLNSDSRPYFNVYGRAISDNGGDFQAVVFKCKADGDLEGNMENGNFLLTKCSGTGFGSDVDSKLYVFSQRETAQAIAGSTASVTWTETISGTPTSGVYRLVLNGYTTSDIAYNATNTVIQAALNGLTGLTGITATVTGTSPTFAITLSSAAILQIGTSTLTPGSVAVA